MSNFRQIPKIFYEDEACFMFVEDASFKMLTPEKVIRFDSGDAMLAKCGNYFFEATNFEEGNEKIFSLIGAYFYPSILEEIFDYDNYVSSLSPNFDVTKINVTNLLDTFRISLDLLLENPEIVNEELVITKLKEFILLLSKTSNAPSVLDFISSIFQSPEYDFKSIIESHLFSNLQIEQIAKLCNLSLSSFKRRFTDIYQESPAKYFTRKKIEKACKLLKEESERINIIAYDCGFESVSTFNRAFKKHMGTTPSKYRIGQN